MDDEKRAFNRYTLWFPVTVNVDESPSSSGRSGADNKGADPDKAPPSGRAREVWAVCHDASAGGILISGSSKLAIGDIVTVSFRASIDDPEERKISGRIVRVERTDDDPRAVWPHRMAIEFLEPVVELQGLFKRVSSRPPPP